jgi:hypothetical protein
MVGKRIYEFISRQNVKKPENPITGFPAKMLYSEHVLQKYFAIM